MTYTGTITVPGQAMPATLKVEVDTSDYGGLQTQMIATVNAGVKEDGCPAGQFQRARVCGTPRSSHSAVHFANGVLHPTLHWR